VEHEAADALIEAWATALTGDAIARFERKQARIAELERAVALVPTPDLAKSLQRVVERLPLAVEIETATIRVREEDGGELRLMAGVGASNFQLRGHALSPVSASHIRTMLALGAQHSTARALGLRWLRVLPLEHERSLVGALLVGSRTARRPDEADAAVLEESARLLGARLATADRSRRTLLRLSTGVARQLLESDARTRQSDDALGALRPRERTILELYADGLSTARIAEVLVISPHTVRTHVKNSLHRLGLHSRDDAVRLVRAARVTALL